jgi:hypothetical protein
MYDIIKTLDDEANSVNSSYFSYGSQPLMSFDRLANERRDA